MQVLDEVPNLKEEIIQYRHLRQVYTCVNKRRVMKVMSTECPPQGLTGPFAWGIGRALWENSHTETNPKYQKV